MTKSAYHLVHYRRFQRPDAGSTTPLFEQMCRGALSAFNTASEPLWERAGDRVYVYPAPTDRQILLNRVADLKSSVFGEFCLVQEKDLQALIELRGQKVKLSDLTIAEIYAISERSAPQGLQFLRGLMYWLTIGDHIFFIKMNNITTNNMQDYFTWLLHTGKFGLSEGSSVCFQAEFDPSVIKGDVGDIRNFRVKGKSTPQINISAPQQEKKENVVQTTKHVAEKIIQSTMAIPVVEAIFGKSKTESLVKSLGPKEYISVEAAVKIRGQRTEESRRKIREIATEVADQTDDEVRIDGKDGIVRDGDAILRVRMPFSIPQDGSSLLEFDNVADQLQEVYRRFVADGKIRA